MIDIIYFEAHFIELYSRIRDNSMCIGTQCFTQNKIAFISFFTIQIVILFKQSRIFFVQKHPRSLLT